nr:hypothetical protein GCM10025730_33350 [Promicromonospora thailandica]
MRGSTPGRLTGAAAAAALLAGAALGTAVPASASGVPSGAADGVRLTSASAHRAHPRPATGPCAWPRTTCR